MNITCVACHNKVSRSADSVTEYLCWENELGRLKEEKTGRVAHIACLNGKQYDERQMTITDVIGTEE